MNCLWPIKIYIFSKNLKFKQKNWEKYILFLKTNSIAYYIWSINPLKIPIFSYPKSIFFHFFGKNIILHDNYWENEKNVTSEIYTLGTKFYYRMKLFWSSCFDKKISMIAAPVQKLSFFFVEKLSNLADFGLFWYRDLYRENTNVKISL